MRICLLILVVLFRRNFFPIRKQVEKDIRDRTACSCLIEILKKTEKLIFRFLGTSKSVGFIRFDQRSEAEVAISKLNGTIPKGQKFSSG